MLKFNNIKELRKLIRTHELYMRILINSHEYYDIAKETMRVHVTGNGRKLLFTDSNNFDYNISLPAAPYIKICGNLVNIYSAKSIKTPMFQILISEGKI